MCGFGGGGLTGAEETGAKAGIKERSGGGRLVPLSFLVFLVCREELGSGGEDGERRVEERQDEGGTRRVDAMPFRSWARGLKAVERERGGNLRTRGAVRVGIPWINPRAMARVKVEMEGEPKER